MGIGAAEQSGLWGDSCCRIFAFGDVQPCGDMRRHHNAKRLERYQCSFRQGQGSHGVVPTPTYSTEGQGYGREV